LPAGLETEDLVAAGNFGLCKAAAAFDPSRDVQFLTYAVTMIRGAILEHCRDWDFYPRSLRDKVKAMQEKSDAANVPSLAPVGSLEIKRPDGEGAASHLDLLKDERPGPEALAMDADARRTVARAIARLPEREAFVVARHYYDGAAFREIAEEIGISESRTYQLNQQAMARLRRCLTSGSEQLV
jgi:RNA polymerase sigma factor for flagellar operon FliA